MRSSAKQVAAMVTAVVWAAFPAVTGSSSSSHRMAWLRARDASTLMSGGNNNEGEAHGKIKAPSGSTFTSIDVGTKGEQIATYWTQKPDEAKATNAYIMIHGKLRDGDAYWTTMDGILTSAIAANVDGATSESIIVAPEFFSEKYNSGQYSKDELAWGDVNAWQAGDIATHPAGTTLTSFDALDALVDEFANATKYPAMKNVTVVGHGGGAQLNQRYAMVAKDGPSNVHIRYIHGDPSSCAYFTTDRPTAVSGASSLPSKASCKYYNTWRYGFDNFTGTADGLKMPKEYFKQYITRDVVSVVGYQDTAASGDTYCMAEMQGGTKRRDRNLAWWQYVNTLAKTNEDLQGFPATFDSLPDWSDVSGNTISMQLVVVPDAEHSADEVFGSDVGRAALFSSGALPTGWRPSGWQPAPAVAPSPNRATNGTSSSGAGAASAGTASPVASSVRTCLASLLVAAMLALPCLM